MHGYLQKIFLTPVAHGRFTKIISIIEWIRTNRLTIHKSLSESVPRQFILVLPQAIPAKS
jgi:hypothetical protein